MINFIERIIKSYGVKIFLESRTVESYLNYYRGIFVDRYGNYVICELFYNDTDLFTKSLKYLKCNEVEKYKDYSLSDSIRSCCKVIGGFEEYKQFKKPLPTKEELDEYFRNALFDVAENIQSIRVPNFSIRSVNVYSNPTLMIIITLNEKGKRIKPLKIFIGEKITYSGTSNLDELIKRVEEIINV